MEGLTEGRIVHFFDHKGARAGHPQPALIVRVWSAEGTVNLVVFPDGSNDPNGRGGPDHSAPLMAIWRTSIQHRSQVSDENAELGAYWDWPARSA